MLVGVLSTRIGMLSGCGSADPPPPLAAYVIDPAVEVGDLAVPDATRRGEAVPFTADADGVLLVAFGFTNCPDVCPTTFSSIRSARSTLDEPERVRVAMVTVDPDRDLDDVLAAYIGGFVPGGHALRTDDPTLLRSVADRFGADYDVTIGDDGHVDVAHTGTVFIVDDQGRVVAGWPFGTSREQMAADLSTLLGDDSPLAAG